MEDLEAALEARHPDRFRRHPMMPAVAGVIYEGGKMLLTRDLHGFWAGVGGWIDEGESPEQAIIREVREELGVEAEVLRAFRPFIAWNVDRASDRASFLLFFFAVRLKSHDFTLDPNEVSDARWVGLNEWRDLPMLPYVRALFEERISEWTAG